MKDKFKRDLLPFQLLFFNEEDRQANRDVKFTKHQEQQMVHWWRKKHLASRILMYILAFSILMMFPMEIWAIAIVFLIGLIYLINHLRSREFVTLMEKTPIDNVEGVAHLIEQNHEFCVVEIDKVARFMLNPIARKIFKNGNHYRIFFTAYPSFILSVEAIETA